MEILSRNEENILNVTRYVETLVLALRAPLTQGAEESASHHYIFAFARQRRKILQNDVRNLRTDAENVGRAVNRQPGFRPSDSQSRTLDAFFLF